MSTENKGQSFMEFIMGDDLDFYENYLVNLSQEEIDLFFKNNPDFMKSYNINDERRLLLQDKMYRGILRRINAK